MATEGMAFGAALRRLRLGGLDTTAGRALLADRGRLGDAAAWEALVARYGGNALAPQLVGESIAELFGGQIAALLAEGESVFGDIPRTPAWRASSYPRSPSPNLLRTPCPSR